MSVGYEYESCLDAVLWEKRTALLQGYELDASNMGGWMLDKHHVLDVQNGETPSSAKCVCVCVLCVCVQSVRSCLHTGVFTCQERQLVFKGCRQVVSNLNCCSKYLTEDEIWFVIPSADNRGAV